MPTRNPKTFTRGQQKALKKIRLCFALLQRKLQYKDLCVQKKKLKRDHMCAISKSQDHYLYKKVNYLFHILRGTGQQLLQQKQQNIMAGDMNYGSLYGSLQFLCQLFESPQPETLVRTSNAKILYRNLKKIFVANRRLQQFPIDMYLDKFMKSFQDESQNKCNNQEMDINVHREKNKTQAMQTFIEKTITEFQSKLVKNQSLRKLSLRSQNQKNQKNEIKEMIEDQDPIKKEQEGKETKEKQSQSKITSSLRIKQQVKESKGIKEQKSQKQKQTKSKPLKIIHTLSIEPPQHPSCRNPPQFHKCSLGDHMMVFCQVCKWTPHKCEIDWSLEEENKQKKKFEAIRAMSQGSVIFNYPIKTLEPTSEENNIAQVLESRGYIYTQQLLTPSPQIPLVCSYPVLCPKLSAIVHKNRKNQRWLPLKISESTIKGAGLGLFATKDIPENVLICSYLGEVGPGSQMKWSRTNKNQEKKEQSMKLRNRESSKPSRQPLPVGKSSKRRSNYQEMPPPPPNKLLPNDSIFTLGWLQDQIVIIAPDIYSNVGRFINCNMPRKCNLKPVICAVYPQNKIQTQNSDNSSINKNEKNEKIEIDGKLAHWKFVQIAVLLITTKKVKAGQELFYDYGGFYDTD